MGDIGGPFAFNADVTDYVSTVPNLLVDFLPDSPGGLDGIGGINHRNVLASSATTAVGAVWSEQDMQTGHGRIALLMDIDWLQDPSRLPIIENLANFLSAGGLCFGDSSIMTWAARPTQLLRAQHARHYDLASDLDRRRPDDGGDRRRRGGGVRLHVRRQPRPPWRARSATRSRRARVCASWPPQRARSTSASTASGPRTTHATCRRPSRSTPTGGTGPTRTTTGSRTSGRTTASG